MAQQDIAEIGFKSDTSGLVAANDQLDKLVDNSKDATRATDRLANTSDKASSVSKKLAKDINLVGRAASTTKTFITGLVTGFVGMFAAQSGFDAMIGGARRTSAAVAELSTLLPIASAELGKMQTQASVLAAQFGTSTAQQIKAYYQAISAGATNAAEATAILTSSNKLAIGGVTDIVTGVDILTTAVNAYAASGLSAADASDALFVGMKAGKTTIGELANGLGNVIPIAASLGVSFDSLVSGIAALTTQGLSTSSAITSIRAALTAVAKPTTEAQKLSKALGIDFSTTALRAKGLSKFLDDVVNGAKRNQDALAVLFGSVEALNGILAFSGAAGQKFNDILAQMTEKTGATDEAFKKIAENLDFRLLLQLNLLSIRAEKFGRLLLALVVPALETFNKYFNDIVQIAGIFIGLNLVRYTVATAGAFISLAKTIWAAGLASSLFTKGIGLKITLLITLGAIIAKLTGKYDDLAESIKKFTTEIVSRLPPEIQNVINSATDGFSGLKDAIDNVDSSVSKSMKAYMDATSGVVDVQKLLADANSSATKKLSEATKAAQAGLDYMISKSEDFANRMADLTSGAINDFFSQWQQGKSVVEAFGATVINVLKDIASQMIRSGILKLISSAFLNSGTPLFGASDFGANGFLNATGNVFEHGNVHRFASGTIVNGATSFGMANGDTGIMGEAGPEGILPLQRGPGGTLGVQAYGGGTSSNQPVPVHLSVSVSGARGNQEIMEMVGKGVDAGLKLFAKRELPVQVAKINRDPRSIG